MNVAARLEELTASSSARRRFRARDLVLGTTGFGGFYSPKAEACGRGQGKAARGVSDSSWTRVRVRVRVAHGARKLGKGKARREQGKGGRGCGHGEVAKPRGLEGRRWSPARPGGESAPDSARRRAQRKEREEGGERKAGRGHVILGQDRVRRARDVEPRPRRGSSVSSLSGRSGAVAGGRGSA